MARGSFDPTQEQQIVVLVDAATLRQAERLIESCEHCNPDRAEIPFEHSRPRNRIRSERDGLHSGITGEVPNCRREILEKTLVEPA